MNRKKRIGVSKTSLFRGGYRKGKEGGIGGGSLDCKKQDGLGGEGNIRSASVKLETIV